VIEHDDPIDTADIIARLDLPLVVKPVSAGSSVGMSIVRNENELPPALESAFGHDSTVIVEVYIDGTELTGGVLGNDDLQALPLIEIIPNPSYEFFDYEAKYTAGATEEICPARVDENVTSKAQLYAVMAHRALCCQGYSRTDMILKDDELYVLDTNTIPGMTATSLFPQAAQAAGISFPELLDRLIQLGIDAHAGAR
jgi:D-alanine-D-alanine ligase